ncbi:MAG: hypothetical protein AB1824_01230 [Acidobacteriota bacterium]
MATETDDPLVVDLAANLGPLFEDIEKGLRQVKDRLQAFRDGKVDLSASADRLTRDLRQATAQTEKFKRDADKAAVVRPTVDSTSLTAAFSRIKGYLGLLGVTAGLAGVVNLLRSSAQAAIENSRAVQEVENAARSLTQATDEQIERLNTWMDAMERASGKTNEELTPGVIQLMAVTEDLTQAQILTQIAAGAAARGLGDFAQNVDDMTRMLVTGSIRGVGAFGQALRDAGKDGVITADEITHLYRAYGDAGAEIDHSAMALDRARVAWDNTKEAIGAVLNAALIPLLPRIRMITQGVGLFIAGIVRLQGEITALGVGAAGTFKALWLHLRGDDAAAEAVDRQAARAALAIKERASEAASSIQQSILEAWSGTTAPIEMGAKAAGQAFAGGMKVGTKKAKEEGAKAADAIKRAMQQAAEASRAAFERAAASWEAISRSMAGDKMKAMDPMEYERSQVRIEAAEKERAARAVLRGQALADALVRIEEWKVQQIQAINERAQAEEDERRRAEEEKAQAESERAIQAAMERVRLEVGAHLDPMQEVIRRAYDSLNAQTALWAERIVSALQPVSQALYSLMMGMKVRWSQVLRQMVVSFLMEFVNRILAMVAGKLVDMIAGKAGAADAAASKKKVAAAKEERKAEYGVAAANMSAAVAEIFAAHSAIPFAGVAIATALAEKAMLTWAIMTALGESISKGIAAFASGGLVDRPTLALIGEAGPELIAPQRDFQAVIAGLVADTVATVRMAALGPTPVAGVGAGAAQTMAWEPHFHGFAFVDTGNRGYMRAAARKMSAALDEERRSRLGR